MIYKTIYMYYLNKLYDIFNHHIVIFFFFFGNELEKDNIKLNFFLLILEQLLIKVKNASNFNHLILL